MREIDIEKERRWKAEQAIKELLENLKSIKNTCKLFLLLQYILVHLFDWYGIDTVFKLLLTTFKHYFLYCGLCSLIISCRTPRDVQFIMYDLKPE